MNVSSSQLLKEFTCSITHNTTQKKLVQIIVILLPVAQKVYEGINNCDKTQ